MLFPWSMRRFPTLPHWAIWREPLDILASLIRNDFIQSWYREALGEIAPSVLRTPYLSAPFGALLSAATTPERKAALLIAIRSFVLFRAVEPENILSFEAFAQNNVKECEHLFQANGLVTYPVQVPDDANIIGKPPQRGQSHQALIPASDQEFLQEVFAPLDRFRPKRGGYVKRA